jgi:hypothetical protein
MTRLSSSIAFYKTLLAVRTVTAINETTVQLEYDIPNRNPITLLLEYDPLTRRLVEASVSLVLMVPCKESDDPGTRGGYGFQGMYRFGRCLERCPGISCGYLESSSTLEG